ncbi:class II glutamine amidotransferase [Kitasatospora sp. NPDC059463]|uniref:class II glutamine amidotransferase n=1 Tax=unclassified Kitasatospora TaxID=2633591 RepID=UPI00367EB3BB
MCRWLAYSGSPIRLEVLLYKPAHSLIDQSLHARMGVETTNGDGFGIGWYPADQGAPGLREPGGVVEPAVFRGTGPAWSDRNLRELARCVSSPLFVAHIRASTGTAVQQTNCHPFRYGPWLWLHNGSIRDFPELKRDLMVAVDASFYPSIEGSTDSELMFHLALTFGLRDDVPGAVERMAGFVEATAARHGVADPLQMTVAVSEGKRLWAFRYSSERASRSLYFSTSVQALRALHPDNPVLQMASEQARIIVSEPLGDLPGAWNPVPESSYAVVQEGHDAIRTFRPQAAAV